MNLIQISDINANEHVPDQKPNLMPGAGLLQVQCFENVRSCPFPDINPDVQEDRERTKHPGSLPDDDQKKQQVAHYQRAFAGESFEITTRFGYSGITTYYTSNFSPLTNTGGEVYALAIFGKDVTEQVSARAEALH